MADLHRENFKKFINDFGNGLSNFSKSDLGKTVIISGAITFSSVILGALLRRGKN